MHIAGSHFGWNKTDIMIIEGTCFKTVSFDLQTNPREPRCSYIAITMCKHRLKISLLCRQRRPNALHCYNFSLMRPFFGHWRGTVWHVPNLIIWPVDLQTPLECFTLQLRWDKWTWSQPLNLVRDFQMPIVSLQFGSNKTAILTLEGNVGTCLKPYHLPGKRRLRCSYIAIGCSKDNLKSALNVVIDVQMHTATLQFGSNGAVILTFEGHVGSNPNPYHLTGKRPLQCSYIATTMCRCSAECRSIFCVKGIWNRYFDNWGAPRDIYETISFDLETLFKRFLDGNSDGQKST